MGPLLFIIYLNDFENSLQYSRASIYADDTNVAVASDDLQRMIDNASPEMLNLSEWVRINKLGPNPQKTEFVVIGHPLKAKHPRLPQSLVLNNHSIKRVTQTKSLGLIVDKKPFVGTTFQPHNGQNELWDLGLKEIEKYTATVTTFRCLL